MGTNPLQGINRRQLLGWLAAAPLLAQMPVVNAKEKQRLYASAAKNSQGGYALSFFNAQGQAQITHLLPSRAHHVLADSTRGWLFTIARRPGKFIDIYDYRNQQPVAALTPQTGYFLQGHALLSPDGRYLYTSEQFTNKKEPTNEQGRLVVRDLAQNFAVVGELLTGGVEPHEFLWMPDGKTLVVANGGIKTAGREKLNLDTMQSSLTYLDSSSGKLLATHQLADEFHQCSIRHLDVAANGQVIVALQYQGNPANPVPLVLAHQQGTKLQVLDIPELIRSQLQQYCGSACFDSSGQFAAVSAPRGNQVMFWDMQQRQFLSSVYVADGCGVAAAAIAGEFLVSNGQGKVYQLNAHSGERQLIHLEKGQRLHWDNHLTAI